MGGEERSASSKWYSVRMVRQAGAELQNVTADGHASLIRITERTKRCPIDRVRVFLDQQIVPSDAFRLFSSLTCSLVLDRFIPVVSSLFRYSSLPRMIILSIPTFILSIKIHSLELPFNLIKSPSRGSLLNIFSFFFFFLKLSLPPGEI